MWKCIYVSPKEDQWSRKENCKSVLSGGLMSPSSTVFSTETYFHISCWDFCDQVYSFSFWGIGKVHSLSEHTFSDFCGGKHDLCWNAATLKALHLEAGLEPYNTFLLFSILMYITLHAVRPNYYVVFCSLPYYIM